MKKYTEPKMDIMNFDLKDVITISAEDLLAEFDDIIKAPDTWF